MRALPSRSRAASLFLSGVLVGIVAAFVLPGYNILLLLEKKAICPLESVILCIYTPMKTHLLFPPSHSLSLHRKSFFLLSSLVPTTLCSISSWRPGSEACATDKMDCRLATKSKNAYFTLITSEDYIERMKPTVYSFLLRLIGCTIVRSVFSSLLLLLLFLPLLLPSSFPRS